MLYTEPDGVLRDYNIYKEKKNILRPSRVRKIYEVCSFLFVNTDLITKFVSAENTR